MQAHLGADRAYVEQLSIDPAEPTALYVRLRYAWDQSDREMEEALNQAALAWLRQRIAPAGP